MVAESFVADADVADTSIAITMRASVKTDRAFITIVVIQVAIGCTTDSDPAPSDAAVSTPETGVFPDRANDVGMRDDAPFADDADGALVILPAQFTEENMPLRMLREGDPIDLWPAPQGGHVVLVGAKVKNFTGDTAILRVKVGYPDTPFIIAQEARSIRLVPVPGEPDTKQPELTTRTQVAHVPLCPDYDPTDIVDNSLEFVIHLATLPDGGGQSAQMSLRLSPSCKNSAGGETFCRCECSANYVLGKCPRDAGRD